MRNKKLKYKKMSDEVLRSGNIRKVNIYNYKEKTGYFIEICMIFIFSTFMILSWLSLIKLFKNKYIFTIYRYTNLGFSLYFPIQLSSFLLILMTLFIVIIITISCLLFIIKLINNIIREEYEKIFLKPPIVISIPIILNSLLFLIGLLMKKYKESTIFFHIGLILDIISLFVLLKINLEKKNKKNVFQINYGSDFMKSIFEDFLFDILMALDLYYFYYVIFEIIYYLFDYNFEILNFSGIVINIFLGIVSSYINWNIKSIAFSIIYLLIYLGIFLFQFTIRLEERKEFKLGYGETYISSIFLIKYFIEFIYIWCCSY